MVDNSLEKAKKQRDRVCTVLDKVFEHQKIAASNAFAGLTGNTRAVILAAEMQSGKSGVSLAIASLQRLSLSDEEIVRQNLLKDSIYIMTMADTSLLAQAEEDLKPASNIVVSNLTRFERDIERVFIHQQPKLVVVDECHYGSGDKAVRYERLFEYIEKINTNCKVVFISATPLSALLAAEGESIINRDIKTKLVFHRTSDAYYGVREMLSNNQVQALGGKARSFLNASRERSEFLETLKKHNGFGWALIRVPNGGAMAAKLLLIRNGFDKENIHIVGQSLTGVPRDELVNVEEFRDKYDEAQNFDNKVVAITVAGFRAGINFGPDMKANLIGTWDSTISNVAAVVQANIGRACGYHENTKAVHYTNRHSVSAYAAVLDYLEENCSASATDDIVGLRSMYEAICRKYEVRALDAGATVSYAGAKVPIAKPADVYLTESYLFVPAQLSVIEPDFSIYTDDPELLSTIHALRSAMLGSDGKPVTKNKQQLRGARWVAANWVNGETYDSLDNASALGTYHDRLTAITATLDDEHDYAFNDIVVGGGGMDTSQKTVAAFIFSLYNLSARKGSIKPAMSQSELDELADWFNMPKDDTYFFLAKRGEVDKELTAKKVEMLTMLANKSPITEHNHFLPR